MKSQLRLALSAGALLLLATWSSNAQDAAKDKKEAKTPNYYPLQVGNTWNYRVEVAGNTAVAISTIAKIEKIDDLPLARLEASINGKIIANEHLRQAADGIYRHRNNGQEISPPIKLLQYPVKAGDKWNGNITVGTEKGKYFCEVSEEAIAVTAGKFKTIRVAIKLESEENGQKKVVSTTYWFAENVGFVKQTVEAGPINVTMELEKFEPAKAKKKAE